MSTVLQRSCLQSTMIVSTVYNDDFYSPEVDIQPCRAVCRRHPPLPSMIAMSTPVVSTTTPPGTSQQWHPVIPVSPGNDCPYLAVSAITPPHHSCCVYQEGLSREAIGGSNHATAVCCHSCVEASCMNKEVTTPHSCLSCAAAAPWGPAAARVTALAPAIS